MNLSVLGIWIKTLEQLSVVVECSKLESPPFVGNQRKLMHTSYVLVCIESSKNHVGWLLDLVSVCVAKTEADYGLVHYLLFVESHKVRRPVVEVWSETENAVDACV